MNEIKLINVGGVDQNIKDQYVRDIIAPSENGLDSSTNLPVSSRHYDEGEYLIAQDRKYYEAITDIDIGDTLVVGTNIRATTVTDEILMLKAQSANVAIETIADMETAATASKAFATGKYVYWNYGVDYGMYEVIADIAEGDAFVTTGVSANIQLANKIGDDVSYLKKELAKVSNRNLLDNPWFTVNQRGFTSVTSPTINTTYVADRWVVKQTGSGSAITRRSDGTIVLDNTNENSQTLAIWNTKEVNQILQVGKKYTMSIMLSNGNVYNTSFVCPELSSSWTSAALLNIPGGAYIGLTVNIDMATFQIGVYNNHSIEVRAVKLELGSRSTLVNDTAPDYATELAKCKRYFVRVKPHIIMLNGNGNHDAPYFNSFRTTPSISNKKVEVYKNISWQDISSYANISGNNDGVVRETIFTGNPQDYGHANARISYDASADM